MKALNAADRERVGEHIGYVRALAAKHFPAYANAVDYDDLVGLGMVALCGAAQRYRAHRGARFSTYAYPRVCGAMLDGVRRQRDRPRIDRFARSGELDADGPVEAAAATAMTPSSEPPDEHLERRRESLALRAALAGLPEHTRRLVELHYFDDLSVEEAGRKLGISKSWASRMLAKALRALERQLATVTVDR